MGAELGAAKPVSQSSVNPPVVPAGSRLAKVALFEGVGCM